MNKLAVALSLSTALFSIAAMGQEENGPTDLDLAKVTKSVGQVLCTAAVNSTGTLAGKFGAKSATHLATGQYQVTFGGGACGANVQAKTGHMRWVQVDTLTAGSISHVRCTTADRAGDVAAVYVLCEGVGGVLEDTSFFLFVAR